MQRAARRVALVVMVVLAAALSLYESSVWTQPEAEAALPDTGIAAPASKATATEGTHRLVRVVDGDTIEVLMDGKKEKVRLIGLNTPESVDPRRPVECFGIEAARRAREMLAGESVRLEPDLSQGERDVYGRLLAYAYLPDDTLFNKRMIAEGYGHEYTFRTPYKYQSDFKAAERAAREQQLGLWAPGACE